MYLGQRIAAIVLSLGLSASLVGCGFHLKGTNMSNVPVAYSKMNIVLPESSRNSIEYNDELQEKLALYLTSSGIQLSNSADAYTLHILDSSNRVLELNGVLRENIIRFTVTFRIENNQGQAVTEPRTVMATRSYQYDAATVNTDRQEEVYLSDVLIDDLAQQIVRQIASNRLPTISPTTTTTPAQ